MEDLLKRLELVEKYCSEEYNDLYYKLSNCRDKAIKMSYAEHIEELAYENGASIYLTDKNELYIDLNDSEQVFVLNVKEEK